MKRTLKKAFQKRHRRWKDWLMDGLVVAVVLGFIGAGALLIFISTLNIPDLSAFEQRRVLQSTKIYDRTGEIVLYDLNQDVKRTVVPYDQISHHIKNATIAIEDDTFFSHWGVRPLAIVRAMIHNFTGGDLRGQGGSTITQQVIKNALLSREKSYIRKIKEAILALRLEQILTKEEILWYYLNETPYGGTIYGVEEASRAFFGKSAAEVTLAEATYLAAIPQAPTFFSPHGNNRAALETRKKRVLEQMVKLGYITQEEYDATLNEEVQFLTNPNTGIRAPHFVMYIREQLAERYGEDELATRGLKVITTLDYTLQTEAEKIVNEYALKNEKQFDASNAALVAIDPATGDVLTMVGSRDYFDEAIDGNYNIAIAERQPGSAIKPFIYAKAFEKGYTPATTLFDVQTQFSVNCAANNFTSNDGCYSPQNYDNAFRGPISMRNALAQSLNIPAVKTLYLAGIQDSIKLAQDVGLSTLTDWRRYGLTLVLGGGEVTLLDMTGAYSVLANEGEKVQTRSILRIEDTKGTVLEEADEQPERHRVLDRDAALQVSDVLSDNVARTPLYGANSLLNFGNRDVAAKTGTTNDRRDAWIFGYTPNLVVGAWAGNNDNSSMNEISGLIISPLWRAYMDVAMKDRPAASFATPAPIPDDIKPVLRSNGHFVDAASLIGDFNNTDVDTVSILAALYQNTHTILHYVDKDNPRGPYPTNPARDPQYANWEYGVTVWKNSRFFGSLGSSSSENGDTVSPLNFDFDLEEIDIGQIQN